MKDKALDLLKHLDFCVISSIGPEGNPQSAMVAFSENDDLEIMIGTSKKSRKFQNIARNPNVSLTFGPHDMQSLQYEGVAEVLAGDELAQRKIHHFKKMPGALKYESDPEQTYLVVKPKWARLVRSGPSVMSEMRFDS